MRAALLLPPSKAQRSGGTGPAWSTIDAPLAAPRARLAATLESHMAESDAALGRLLGASGDTLARSVAANRAVRSAPTLPAVERYTGVLYDELDRPSLPRSARARLDRATLVLGALHGVGGLREPLPEHRLGFGMSLPGLGRLARWWRPHVTEELRRLLQGAVVWDLLPGEHAAAWHPDQVAMRRRFVVRFVDAQGRTVSHWNKLLKGALARHLAQVGLGELAALESFEHPSGYRWDPDATVVDGAVWNLVLRAPG